MIVIAFCINKGNQAICGEPECRNQHWHYCQSPNSFAYPEKFKILKKKNDNINNLEFRLLDTQKQISG